jgi:hypothetical protein
MGIIASSGNVEVVTRPLFTSCGIARPGQSTLADRPRPAPCSTASRGERDIGATANQVAEQANPCQLSANSPPARQAADTPNPRATTFGTSLRTLAIGVVT